MCDICQSRPHLSQCPLAPDPELERCLGCKGAFDPEDLFHGLCRDCIDHAAPEKYIEYVFSQEAAAFVSWYWEIDFRPGADKQVVLDLLIPTMRKDIDLGGLARDYCLDGLESRGRFAAYLEEGLR